MVGTSNSLIQDNECGVLGVQGQTDLREIASKNLRQPGGGGSGPGHRPLIPALQHSRGRGRRISEFKASLELQQNQPKRLKGKKSFSEKGND